MKKISPISETKRKSFRVKFPYRPDPVDVMSTTESEDEDGSEQLIDLPVCVHGKLLHDIKEVVAFCAVGGEDEPLCEDCAKNICDVCGNIVCNRHLEKAGTQKCCSNHTWWEKAKLAWFS